MPAITLNCAEERRGRRRGLGKELRFDGPDHRPHAAHSAAGRCRRRHRHDAELGGQLVALRFDWLDDHDALGGRAGAPQPADQCRGHVATADEGDRRVLRVHAAQCRQAAQSRGAESSHAKAASAA